MFTSLKKIALTGAGAVLLAGIVACTEEEPAASPTVAPTATVAPEPTTVPAPGIRIVDPWARPGAMVNLDGTEDGDVGMDMGDDSAGMTMDGDSSATTGENMAMSDGATMDIDGGSAEMTMDDGMDMGGGGSHARSGTGAIYFTIVNDGDAGDTLVAIHDVHVTSPGDTAGVVELHETSIDDEGVMAMRQVAGIPVAAAGSTELKPGGLHVMLMGLKRDLVPGDTITLTLEFEKSEDVVVQATVREI